MGKGGSGNGTDLKSYTYAMMRGFLEKEKTR